jgi:hypothetical protein
VGALWQATRAREQTEIARQKAAYAQQQADYAEKLRQEEARLKTKAEELRAAAEAALAAAEAARQRTPNQPTTARVTELLDKAQTEYAAAQRTSPVVAPAKEVTAPNEPQPKVGPSPPPRVYLHIQDEDQRARAQQIEKALVAKKFVVPGIQTLRTGPTTGAQVRFFREDERDGANQIVGILRDSQVRGAEAKYIPGYEQSTKIRPNHYEVWFAPDALQ